MTIRNVAARPIPTMIDSIGKPGIPGPTNPLVTPAVVVVVVVARAVDVLVADVVAPLIWVNVDVMGTVLVTVPTVLDE